MCNVHSHTPTVTYTYCRRLTILYITPCAHKPIRTNIVFNFLRMFSLSLSSVFKEHDVKQRYSSYCLKSALLKIWFRILVYHMKSHETHHFLTKIEFMYPNMHSWLTYVNVLDTAHKMMTDILKGYKLSIKIYVAVLFFGTMGFVCTPQAWDG
jgi:hypothetical protein